MPYAQCSHVVSSGRRHSRGFATDFPLVPLLAVGEVLLVGADELLHSTHVGAETKAAVLAKWAAWLCHHQAFPPTRAPRVIRMF